MELRSGSADDGTYQHSTTLPIGQYAYSFAFDDTHGGIASTAWQGGPAVFGTDEVPIDIVIQSTTISTDLELSYSLTGSSGPWEPIPVTQQILEPLLVPAGSTVSFLAGVASPNFEYRGYQVSVEGNVVGEGCRRRSGSEAGGGLKV